MNRQDIIDISNAIADEYRRKHGLILTLRQLYYQFVARGLLPNGQKIYKRIGATLTEARLKGEFPLDGLEDRGRTVGRTDAECSDDVDEAIVNVAHSLRRLPLWLRYGRWHGQPYKVFVWIEKEALAGVIEPVCNRLGLGLFPCRGYPSVSALAQWVRTTHEMVGLGEQARILYLGDHDPDGLQIPLSAEETIHTIMDLEGTYFPFTMNVIALTLPQIRAFNPPPMPAKPSSARFEKYVRKTGTTDAWELDALDPLQLRTLLETEVERYFDPDIYADNLDHIRGLRDEMVDRITDDLDWIETQFRHDLP